MIFLNFFSLIIEIILIIIITIIQTTEWEFSTSSYGANFTDITTTSGYREARSIDNMTLIMVTVFGIICTFGLIG